MTTKIKLPKISKETKAIALIASEYAVSALVKEIVKAHEADKLEDFCRSHFDYHPYLDLKRFANRVSKQDLEALMGFSVPDSQFRQAKIDIAQIKIKAQHWSKYLLAFCLPHSSAYRRLQAKSLYN